MAAGRRRIFKKKKKIMQQPFHLEKIIHAFKVPFAVFTTSYLIQQPSAPTLMSSSIEGRRGMLADAGRTSLEALSLSYMPSFDL